jgi:pyrimidine-specific ribonucleoside hydrolase
VVIDCDTGVDDALALLLALRSAALDVRAVTCVAGNVGLDDVVANTLRVLDAAGAPDLPVGRGADRPLLEPARAARHVHGEDGMADLGLPASSRAVAPAVELLWRTLVEAPATVVTLAPLTNLALLLRTHPEVVERIERVVLVGGAANVGNATPSAEFNVWHDPEAAAVVFGAGLPITMYGLDVFYQPQVERAPAEKLAAADEPGTRLAGRLLLHQLDRFGTGNLGDAGAVAAVIEPAGLTTAPCQVRVELAGRHTRGATIVDRRTWPAGPPTDAFAAGPAPASTVDVAFGVDAARYRTLFLDTVTR